MNFILGKELVYFKHVGFDKPEKLLEMQEQVGFPVNEHSNFHLHYEPIHKKVNDKLIIVNYTITWACFRIAQSVWEKTQPNHFTIERQEALCF